MAASKVSSYTKHIFNRGPADPGGTREIFMFGTITLANCTTDDFGFDISDDIPNLEGIIIQGDGGFPVQYDYSGRAIEVYVQDSGSDSALTAASGTDLGALVFRYFAWGY